MVKHVVASALVALALVAFSPAESRAQIVNGNFDVGNPFDNWQGSSGTSVVDTGAQSPTQSIIFSSGSATLSQTFSAVAGQYFLSFYMRAITSAPAAIATISVLVNGQDFGGFTVGPNYGRTVTAAVALQATGNTIQFYNANANGALGNFVQLDTVSFEAVPTPLAGAGGLSFALGACVLGWSRLRRKTAKA